jgi:dihydroneopterin aldolase
MDMKAEAMYIKLQGMRYFACHGVLPQERKVGAYFTVDLRLETDFLRAALADDLTGTVSYADVHEAVRQEMAQPAQLLEHVAYRIARRLLDQFPVVQSVEIGVSKENPPMGAEGRRIGVEARFKR